MLVEALRIKKSVKNKKEEIEITPWIVKMDPKKKITIPW